MNSVVTSQGRTFRSPQIHIFMLQPPLHEWLPLVACRPVEVPAVIFFLDTGVEVCLPHAFLVLKAKSMTSVISSRDR